MSLEDWAIQARNDSLDWSSILSEAAADPKIGAIFWEKKRAEWRELVKDRFDSTARKQLLGIKNKNLRSQILRTLVSISDLTRSLEEKGEDMEGCGDILFRIQTNLDKLVKCIDRLGSSYPKLKKAISAGPKAKQKSSEIKKISANKTSPPPVPDKEVSKRRKGLHGLGEGRKLHGGAKSQEDSTGDAAQKSKKHRSHLSVPAELPPDSVSAKAAQKEMSIKEEMVSDDQVIEEFDVEVVADEAQESIRKTDQNGKASSSSGRPLTQEGPQLPSEPPHETAPEPSAGEEGKIRRVDESNALPSKEEKQIEKKEIEENQKEWEEDEDSEDVEIQSVDLLKDEDVLEQPVIRLTKKREESVANHPVEKEKNKSADEPTENGGASKAEEEKEIEFAVSASPSEQSISPRTETGAGEQPTGCSDEAPSTRRSPKNYGAEDARLTLLELYLKSLKSQDTLQAEQMMMLDQVVTILGSALTRDSGDLSSRIARLDRIYTRPDESPLKGKQREEREKEIFTLCRIMRGTLMESWQEASPEGLDLELTAATSMDHASELPIVRLERSLREGLTRWRLPNFLSRLVGPAQSFCYKVKAQKGVPLSWPIPENRLELSLVAEPEGVYIQALHLLEPSEDAPLGLIACPETHGGGVCFQILLSSETEKNKKPTPAGDDQEGRFAEQTNEELVKRFAVSEVSRFVRHLEKYPQR